MVPSNGSMQLPSLSSNGCEADGKDSVATSKCQCQCQGKETKGTGRDPNNLDMNGRQEKGAWVCGGFVRISSGTELTID